jgi:hypothetical protein
MKDTTIVSENEVASLIRKIDKKNILGGIWMEILKITKKDFHSCEDIINYYYM